MKTLIKKLTNRIQPVCPISNGVDGPYEYIQLKKDEDIILETPRSCLEFLKIREYTSKQYESSKNHHIWLSKYEMETIRNHRHTVTTVP